MDSYGFEMEFQSTHPVWGGTGNKGRFLRVQPFQSTHPVWGGTTAAYEDLTKQAISIHPPRVGWDEQGRKAFAMDHDFNPPTPCGVGLI